MTSEATLRERQEMDAAVSGKTLVDILERNVRQHGDVPAIFWKAEGVWRNLTWSQYQKVVHEAAAGLVSLGLGASDFVALQASNRPEHVIADLGAVHAGAIGVSIYNTFAQSQVSYVANHCEAKVAILEDLSFMKRWEAIKPELTHLQYVVLMEGAENYETVEWVLSWDDLLARGRAALAADPDLVKRSSAQIKPETIATLIYTSGTTGTPKGVEFTHRHVLWTTESARRAVHFPPNPRMVSFLPLAHIAERMATHYMGLWLAGQVYLCPALDQVLEYITKARPQVFVAVPRVYEKFQARLHARFDEDPKRKNLILSAVENGKKKVRAEQEGRNPGLLVNLKHALFERLIFTKVRHGLGMDDLTIAITTAAPINPDIIVFFNALGIPLCELFGMSECTGPATTNVPEANKIGTVGRAIPGVEIALAEDGEILIRGGNVANGYYRMPEETAESFDAEGWLHSGDLGSIDADGFVSIVGRKKEILISAAGKNIAPAKLETILKNHPLIAQACMIGDARNYITMILSLDPEEAPGWAKARGIPYTDLAAFAEHPEVVAEVQRAVDEANLQVSRVEQVKKFTVVPDAWTPDSGEITPSLKLKRRVVLERYADQIEAMYS